MAGALNKLPVAVSGMIFFNAPVTFFSVTAVLIGMAGFLSNWEAGFCAGLVYAAAKSIQSKHAKMVLPTTNSASSVMNASGQSHREAEKGVA